MSHANAWTLGFVSIIFKTSFLQRRRREAFTPCRDCLQWECRGSSTECRGLSVEGKSAVLFSLLPLVPRSLATRHS